MWTVTKIFRFKSEQMKVCGHFILKKKKKKTVDIRVYNVHTFSVTVVLNALSHSVHTSKLWGTLLLWTKIDGQMTLSTWSNLFSQLLYLSLLEVLLTSGMCFLCSWQIVNRKAHTWTVSGWHCWLRWKFFCLFLCVYKAVCLSCLITTKGQRMTDFHSLFLNVSLIFNHIKATNVDVLFKFICI